MPVSVKVDLDDFNLRMDILKGQIHVSGDITTTLIADVKLIINARKKTAYAWYNVSGARLGKNLQNCSEYVFNNMPALAELKQMIGAWGMDAICMGNDGTYDSFKLDSKALLPPGLLPANVQLDTGARMDEHYLVNYLIINASSPGLRSSADTADIKMQATKTTADKPRDADIDPAPFGTCYPWPPRTLETNITFQAMDVSEVPSMIARAIQEGLFQKIMLATVQPKAVDV